MIPAFTLGFFGSLHCVGMCGPLAMAIPVGENKLLAAWYLLLYNLGRTITYTLLGLFFGLLGYTATVAGLQSILSVVLGVVLILMVVFAATLESRLLTLPVISRIYIFVKRKLATLLNKKSVPSFLLFGMLNGLLPCGLVYIAIVGAMAVGSTLKGMLYMASFGLGTIPLMLAVVLLGQSVGLRWRNLFKKLYPGAHYCGRYIDDITRPPY